MWQRPHFYPWTINWMFPIPFLFSWRHWVWNFMGRLIQNQTCNFSEIPPTISHNLGWQELGRRISGHLHLKGLHPKTTCVHVASSLLFEQSVMHILNQIIQAQIGSDARGKVKGNWGISQATWRILGFAHWKRTKVRKRSIEVEAWALSTYLGRMRNSTFEPLAVPAFVWSLEGGNVLIVTPVKSWEVLLLCQAGRTLCILVKKSLSITLNFVHLNFLYS